MANFEIYPLSRFESGQTFIRRPRHFLQFSFDDNHQCRIGSDEALRYYYPPYIAAPGQSIPRIDLSNGLETWIKSDQNFDGHLDALLATIQAHEESLLEKGETDVKTDADIITWRGMMTKVRRPRATSPSIYVLTEGHVQIMAAAFDNYSDFEMNATCYQVGHVTQTTLCNIEQQLT